MSRRLFTDEQLNFLLEHQADITRKEMAKLMNEKFGTSFTTKQIVTYCNNHRILSNNNGQFKKGHVSHNKGKKIEEYMSPEGIKNSSKTRFKKGQNPINHRPVGSERLSKDGYIETKVKEPNVWKLKHRHIWEQEHGEVPEGYALLFLDQIRTNCSIENLKLVKRTELVRINHQNNLTVCPKINESIVLTERINQTVRERIDSE